MPQDSAPLHPVAAAFVREDLLLSEILERVPEPRDKMVQAMLALRKFLVRDCPWEEALDRAESVRLGSFDPCLTIIFLGLWAICSRRAGRLGEVEALARTASAMVKPDMPPEIRSMASNSECIAASVNGDWFREDRAMRQMVSVLPENSPRYASQLLGTTSSLAYRWAALDYEPQLTATAARNGHLASSVAFTRLVQYAETGRVADAQAQLPLLAATPKVATYYEGYASGFRELLVLMAGSSGAAAGGSRQEVSALLLAGRKREALDLARRAALEAPETPIVGQSFNSFDLIRAELACGNLEAALRLLRLRAQRGNLLPISDFFAARVELLGGRRERALRLLRSFVEAVGRYRARGRVEFELRLASEMSPEDAAMLLAWCDGRPPEMGAGGPKDAAVAAGDAAGEPRGAGRLIGTSKLVETVRQSVARLAAFPSPVLICGEPGSGKRIVARALHESGPRAQAPFVDLGCGEIAASLLPQEIFGRGGETPFKGALFEAGDGSLLLRDVDRLPPEVQEALLEVIETGEVRSGGDAQPRRPTCRILTTASADLAGLVEAGRFNGGLFERLRRMAIAVPALAERPEDIPPLAEHFLAAGRSDGKTPRLSEALRLELMRRQWPGSVAELMECIERMRLAGSEKLDYDLADLPKPTVAP